MAAAGYGGLIMDADEERAVARLIALLASLEVSVRGLSDKGYLSKRFMRAIERELTDLLARSITPADRLH
jgi:hypothetical protein